MSRSHDVDPASAASVYGRLQQLARYEGRPTDEMLTLYALERVLEPAHPHEVLRRLRAQGWGAAGRLPAAAAHP